MSEEKAGWYYVGDGRLQYMDADGWTDQYTLADGDPKSDVEPDEAPVDNSGSAAGEEVPGREKRDGPSIVKRCSGAAHRAIAVLIRLVVALWRLIVALWRLIAKGYRKASASLSNRPRARRHGDRSAVRAQLSLACHGEEPKFDQDRAKTCESCGADVGCETLLCPACVAP